MALCVTISTIMIAIEPHASLQKTKCLGLYAIVFHVLVVNNMNVG